MIHIKYMQCVVINGSSRVLDVLRTGGSASGSIKSGNNVDIWNTGDDECQLFKIQLENNGYYSIRLKSNNNLALTSYGTGNGSGAGTSATSTGNVFISTWTGSNNQYWCFNQITATPAFAYRQTSGLTGVKYFISNSASQFTNYIDNGVSRWNPTINLSKITDSMTSDIDFYAVDKDHFDYIGDLGDTWAGVSLGYTSSTNYIDRDLGHWDYSEISLNTQTFLNSTIATDEQKRGVIAHELGHSFGLKHYNTLSSIMYPTGNVDGVSTTPQNIDRTAINYKY